MSLISLQPFTVSLVESNSCAFHLASYAAGTFLKVELIRSWRSAKGGLVLLIKSIAIDHTEAEHE